MINRRVIALNMEIFFLNVFDCTIQFLLVTCHYLVQIFIIFLFGFTKWFNISFD